MLRKNYLNLTGAVVTHLLFTLLVATLLPDTGVQLAIVGAAAGALASAAAAKGLEQLFPGQTASNQPFLTDAQRRAQKIAGDFAETGQFTGGRTVGENVGVGGGDFGVTGSERTGLTRLQDLLDSGIPESFQLGEGALQDFLQTSPQAIESQFQPFLDQQARAKGESIDALKRNAAFTGNLFSTDTIQGLGDVEARFNETAASKLAALIDSERTRRLSAATASIGAGQARQGAELGLVGASQDFGGLTRQLNDAEIRRRDEEILRRRSEALLPINTAVSLAGQRAEFGVPSVTVSPFQELISGLGKSVGGSAQRGVSKFLTDRKRVKSLGQTEERF